MQTVCRGHCVTEFGKVATGFAGTLLPKRLRFTTRSRSLSCKISFMATPSRIASSHQFAAGSAFLSSVRRNFSAPCKAVQGDVSLDISVFCQSDCKSIQVPSVRRGSDWPLQFLKDTRRRSRSLRWTQITSPSGRRRTDCRAAWKS